jgi:hypothetical protein
MTKSLKPLDFLGVGATKAGTTTLFHYLRHHPQIYLPANKEAHFFDDDEKYIHGWNAFAQEHFAKGQPSQLWGKISPRYMRDMRVPERIFGTMPSVNLFALLRNPIDRAFSHYRMLKRLGQETRDFKDVVLTQLDAKNIAEARSQAVSGTLSLLAQSEYGRILSKYFAVFPSEQLLILFTDDLEKTPQIVLDRLMFFLKLEPGFAPSNLGKKYFVGGDRNQFTWMKSRASRTALLRWIWHRLPNEHRKFFLLWFENEINVKSSIPPSISLELRQELTEFFRPDVRKLEELVGSKTPWPDFK